MLALTAALSRLWCHRLGRSREAAGAEDEPPEVAALAAGTVAADGFGYAFVAGYRGDGSDPDAFFVDVYDAADGDVNRASGYAVSNTRRVGITGGSVVVDYFRNVYTANFQPMLTTTGQVFLGDEGVPEPSISIWFPGAVQ